MESLSALQQARYQYIPAIPALIRMDASRIQQESIRADAPPPDEAIRAHYPHTYTTTALTFREGANPTAHARRRCGVLLSGGQAPGGHNVIAGLYDGLTSANVQSALYGFIGGPGGFLRGEAQLLTSARIDRYRNTGGFDIIGSDRTKIEREEQLTAAVRTVQNLQLDSLVVIGGDDSNTNAALLAERFAAERLGVQVIGVPKTIDGDLKNGYIEASFGFDTATKVYAGLIGDVARDTRSSGKYWNFIKLMGRSASHIALECALQTHPNVCLIGEEIAAKRLPLKRVIYDICRVIADRADRGEDYGVVLIPEGIVEFIPETAQLIHELNLCWRDYEAVFSALTTLELKKRWLSARLTPAAFATLVQLPPEIAEQFLGLRDPHGNILVSQIETEKLFITMIADSLHGMKGAGSYRGSFRPLAQFYGYEGRSVAPSNFDANYCYTLGRTAFLLIAAGVTGYLACVQNLAAPAAEWSAGGVPLTALMQREERKGTPVPVIAKTLVDLSGAPFRAFAAARERWALHTDYVYPGAIQYFGSDMLCNRVTETLRLEAEARHV